MAPIIALFDIDGTLLRAGGAGRRSVELALDEVLDDLDGNVSLHSVEFAGRTDPWIVRTALMQYGVTADDALIHEVLRRYASHLPRELELARAFEVLPGVLALLSELSTRDDVVLGLGTGNTEPAAYAKLARGGLDSFFAFGGFGSDHTDRAELLRAGLKRGLERGRRRWRHAPRCGRGPRDRSALRSGEHRRLRRTGLGSRRSEHRGVGSGLSGSPLRL
jgi:phosphoglycolate phosphatase-like HAD superfamily hydrolase